MTASAACRTHSAMSRSRSSPPTRIDASETMPPREITATSVVPAPATATELATGSWMGSPSPIAAAIGASSRCACAAPARRAAWRSARRSIAVAAAGTVSRIRGREKRPMPHRSSTPWRSLAATSKSVVAPACIGRKATTWRGVRPTSSIASWPRATTEPFLVSIATTVGSAKMSPPASVATRVIDVPTSIARVGAMATMVGATPNPVDWSLPFLRCSDASATTSRCVAPAVRGARRPPRSAPGCTPPSCPGRSTARPCRRPGRRAHGGSRPSSPRAPRPCS